MQHITPFLWFDSQAQEAAKLYTSVFPKSKITTVTRYGEVAARHVGRKTGSIMTVGFKLLGQEFVNINGGPIFPQSPAISLFVHCKTVKEVDRVFAKLSSGGQIMMPLDKYSFAERFAFFKDRFGVSWQVVLSKAKPHITPCLLFVGKDMGKAKAAVKFYTSVFKGKITSMSLYGKGEPGAQGTVKHSTFMLSDQEFAAMDGPGPHTFGFNESISFVVNCKTQQEIDMYWKKLSAGGSHVQCGWLKDKFGVSWQITPADIFKMLSDKDPTRSARVHEAVMGMIKIDIATLKKAYAKT